MRKLLCALISISAFLFSGSTARAQRIITVAGITTEGYLGDKGPATRCQMHWPEAVALDLIWNIYIADADNNVIRKIDSTGKIFTVVGSGFESGTGTGGFGGDTGPASAARLNYPSGVAVDFAGNIYIADQRNSRIRKVDPTGIITTIAGTGVAGFGGDGGAASAAQLNFPTRITIDASGNLYVADAGNHCIRKIDVSGNISTVAGIGGTAGFAGDGALANAALLNDPQDMAVDPTGILYIADYSNNRIRKVDLSGNISTYAGIGYPGFSGDGGPATAANIFEPSGIVTDAAGNVFFSDFANARVRRIDALTGIITTYAGNGTQGYSGDNGPAKTAEIYFPQGLATNNIGGVYIADKGNDRIRFASTTLADEPVAQTENTLDVYPNPVQGNIYVVMHSPAIEPVEIQIYDQLGQKVAGWSSLTNTSLAVNIDLPPGMYFLSARTAATVHNQKVFVR